MNSKVAEYIWLFILFDSIAAITFYNNTKILLAFILLSIIIYVYIYKSIVSLKVSRYLIQR